jgi:hypothetical protein
MEDSLVTATAMGVRALTLYPPAGSQTVDEELARARRWPHAVSPRSAEDRACG